MQTENLELADLWLWLWNWLLSGYAFSKAKVPISVTSRMVEEEQVRGQQRKRCRKRNAMSEEGRKKRNKTKVDKEVECHFAQPCFVKA